MAHASIAEPYWIIREPGKQIGFGTVEFNGDTDPGRALVRYWESLPNSMRAYMAGLENDPDVTATLVTLSIIGGQPHLSPVVL